jgi:hypothetical protein
VGEVEAEVEVDQEVVEGGIEESIERVRGFHLMRTLIPMIEDFEKFAFTNFRSIGVINEFIATSWSNGVWCRYIR